uniref:Uncharacterized protein n=1 Tax=Oryza nivara TaxID=4536 RepID=A0A0E0I6X0_ORYNI
MGKSYFDSYPDLAEQIKETSYPNRLALLRGLFYWLMLSEKTNSSHGQNKTNVTKEEPSFKQGLIEVLSKPFCPREYDKLYGMATVREPSIRELRTRSGSKTYYSNSWMGKSYLVPTQVCVYVSCTYFYCDRHFSLFSLPYVSSKVMKYRSI